VCFFPNVIKYPELNVVRKPEAGRKVRDVVEALKKNYHQILFF